MQMKCKSAHAPASSIGRLQSDRPLMTVDIANRSALACLLFVCLFVFNVPVGTGWFHSRPFPVVYRRRRHRRQCLVLIGVAVHVRLSMAIDADRCDRPQSFFFFFFFFLLWNAGRSAAYWLRLRWPRQRQSGLVSRPERTCRSEAPARLGSVP